MIVECYKNGLYLDLTSERYHYPFLAWTLNTSMTDVISYRRTESRWKISLQDSRVNDLSVMCFTRDKNFMNQNHRFCCLLISWMIAKICSSCFDSTCWYGTGQIDFGLQDSDRTGKMSKVSKTEYLKQIQNN